MNPDQPSDPHWDRLPHFFAGELSAADAAELEQWMAADPERGEAVARLREVWDLTGVLAQTWDAGAALRRLEQAADAERAKVIAHIGSGLSQLRPRRGAVALGLRAAAVVALVAGGAALWQARSPRPAAPPHAKTGYAEYATRRGQRLSLRLPDGTAVTLAPGSTLRRPSTYGAQARTLYLEGEAYFDVTHDAAHPFTVQTSHAVTHDLGTRFVIRAYAADRETDVVVAEGKVSVAAAATAAAAALSGDTIVLERGHRARVTPGGQLELTAGVALDHYFAWTEGRLVFQDTPLSDVAEQLALWYDVDVRLGDPALGTRRLTASFTDQPITTVFDKIAAPLGLEITRTGRTYTLTSR